MRTGRLRSAGIVRGRIGRNPTLSPPQSATSLVPTPAMDCRHHRRLVRLQFLAGLVLRHVVGRPRLIANPLLQE